MDLTYDEAIVELRVISVAMDTAETPDAAEHAGALADTFLEIVDSFGGDRRSAAIAMVAMFAVLGGALVDVDAVSPGALLRLITGFGVRAADAAEEDGEAAA